MEALPTVVQGWRRASGASSGMLSLWVMVHVPAQGPGLGKSSKLQSFIGKQ